MSKTRSPKFPDSKWVYFVYNWGSPIGAFTNVTLAAALYRLYSEKWGEPLPEGALTVVRYAPASDFYKCRQQDITSSIKKLVSNG